MSTIPTDTERQRFNRSIPADQENYSRKRIKVSGPLRENFISRFVRGRVFEWVMTVSMILMSIELLIWPEALSQSAFRYVLILSSAETIATTLLIVGWARFCALMLNGQSIAGYKAGPFVRSVCAVISSAVWAQFVVALTQLSYTQGYPSPGIPIWFVITFAELYTAYGAVRSA